MSTRAVLTAAEMQACDRATTEEFGIPGIELMRAAAAAVADFARHRFRGVRRVTVLCGRGNNGGDGMMAARLLAEAGLDVTTLLCGAPDALQGDAAQAWRELTNPMRGRVEVVRSGDDLARHSQALETDLILDALLGAGFTPPLKGLALDVLQWARSSPAPVLAVDLPSGWPSDATSATVEGPVFAADAVVTFTAPKPAHVFGHLTRHWDQPIVVAAIGSPPAAVVSASRLTWAGSALALVHNARGTAANKGNFGHVLAVGGSFGWAGGKSGAPAMVGMGALRAGAGLVTAAVPEPALVPVASFAPELMTWPLAAGSKGQISAANAGPDRISAMMTGKTVLAVGPGLGQSSDTAQFMTALLSSTQVPVVIDADGLNILAHNLPLLAEIARKRTVVLTPHPGEMARLAAVTTQEVQASRLAIAREFAQKMGVILVLKGARTLIAHPDGSVAVNTSGNPGMAKGGSGDLLTGIVAGLLAQYPHHPAQAVEAAVCLHGLAADFAVRRVDEHTLLATDCLRHLARAFRYPGFHFGKIASSRYVCLQGTLRADYGRAGRPI